MKRMLTVMAKKKATKAARSFFLPGMNARGFQTLGGFS